MNEFFDTNNIFKIYFSEIFKKKNYEKKSENINSSKNNLSINDGDNEERNSLEIFNDIISTSLIDNEIKENNQKLCKIIKNKFLKKIGKVEKCIFEEDQDVRLK